MMCWWPIFLRYSRITCLACCHVGRSIRLGFGLDGFANLRSGNGQAVRLKHGTE
jgi:hypothetical protein